MFLIIPLGGKGERFKKNNYSMPKALIKIFGKPILYYLLDNLNLTNIDFVYIPYNKEYIHFHFEAQLKKDYPYVNFKFLTLEYDTDGAAHTLNIALKKLNNIEDQPVLSLDSDNFFSTDVISLWNGENKIICITDESNEPIYSYIKVNKNNEIIEMQEKVKISNNACTGAYGFSSYKQLLRYSQIILDKKIKQKNEYYTSNIISYMINEQNKINIGIINKNEWHCLGTPIQLRQFYHNYPKISSLNNGLKINQLRICFDLDNTLVSYPKVKDDYSTVEPIQKNIDYLKYLKSFGNIIIIHTSRKMKTHQENIGTLMKNIGFITFETLEKFDIPYDEIYFGKPEANIYIDDCGYNSFIDLEKELGFYQNNIEPRSFNELELNSIELITKKSNDLSGEIYYYQNIPNKIKDLFPLMIDYDIKNKWYKVEKINGLSLNEYYLSELLTEELLKNVMNSIKRLQSVETNSNINIYANYCNKLEKRFQNYDYSKFSNSKENYESIYNYLKKYENENRGKQTVIHGDPVLTNILINQFDKIKFIDMRGKIDNQLSIEGDYLYDWAKLYQSFIGYDKILMNKNINIKYEEKMKKIFEDYFIELYDKDKLKDLKMITKSLLFTLIPLHDNDKCKLYYKLI